MLSPSVSAEVKSVRLIEMGPVKFGLSGLSPDLSMRRPLLQLIHSLRSRPT